MTKKQQKPNLDPITITLTIDPALKLNAQGERAMGTTIIARRGDVAQLRQLDVTNWKIDLPAVLDDLVRMLMGGQLVLPAFPNMGDARGVSSNDEPNAKPDGETGEEAETGETGEEQPSAEETEADDIPEHPGQPEQAVAEDDAEPDLDEPLQPDTLAEIDDEIRYEDEPTPGLDDYPAGEEVDELPPAA